MKDSDNDKNIKAEIDDVEKVIKAKQIAESKPDSLKEIWDQYSDVEKIVCLDVLGLGITRYLTNINIKNEDDLTQSVSELYKKINEQQKEIVIGKLSKKYDILESIILRDSQYQQSRDKLDEIEKTDVTDSTFQQQQSKDNEKQINNQNGKKAVTDSTFQQQQSQNNEQKINDQISDSNDNTIQPNTQETANEERIISVFKEFFDNKVGEIKLDNGQLSIGGESLDAANLKTRLDTLGETLANTLTQEKAFKDNAKQPTQEQISACADQVRQYIMDKLRHKNESLNSLKDQQIDPEVLKELKKANHNSLYRGLRWLFPKKLVKTLARWQPTWFEKNNGLTKQLDDKVLGALKNHVNENVKKDNPGPKRLNKHNLRGF